MPVKDLNIGDLFRVVGEATAWRKMSQTQARREIPIRSPREYVPPRLLTDFREKELEILERADTSEIRRFEDLLILRNGEVLLYCTGMISIYRCTPGEKFTEFVLTGSAFNSSEAKKFSEDVAIAFNIKAGSKHLNRPGGTDIIAYKGRVYGRATQAEVLGKKGYGGYKKVTKIDGARRLLIAGMLTIPEESALYDIIQEHFVDVAE